MKLIQKTYRSTLKWLIPVVIASSFYCYLIIESVQHEETDEFLTYEMERLIHYHNENNDLPEFHKMAAILPDVKYDQPIFKDTLLLEPADNEMVPHRELRFTIQHNGKDFTIVLRHLLMGQDDMVEGTLLIVGGILILIILLLFFVLNNINIRVWKPFYKTLDTLVKYEINQPAPEMATAEIAEFDTLNTTLNRLLEKSSADYQRSKEFNENVSHELQTHLAIIRANTEKLLNQFGEDETNLQTLTKIYSASSDLSRIQKSLLLLNKIGNQEFNKNEHFDLDEVLSEVLETFSEVMEMQEIKVEIKREKCMLFADKGLAEILLNNLIKNAIKHNIASGYISIVLDKKSFIIENSGHSYAGNPSDLVQRFTTGVSGNTGIGLSIVKQICTLYDYKLDYTIYNQNIHKTAILFQI